MKKRYLILLSAGMMLTSIGIAVTHFDINVNLFEKHIESEGVKRIEDVLIGKQQAAAGSQSKILDNLFVIASGPNKGKKVPLYDGTIEKYYYAAGTGTEGNLYRSKDMVHWEGPIRFISTDRKTLPGYADQDATFSSYGASDFLYHNGVMNYGFNSNNLLHGNPATMHTEKPDFKHSFLDRQFDTGIDLQFFVAHNGDLIYIRKRNPNEPDPNTGDKVVEFKAAAWLGKVQSFFNEQGNQARGIGKELLHTQPGHWGNLNFVNFEGPEMYYHNGQYYLLYAANQMFPESGLYETGVAQADHYDRFTNASKYPGKLLARNIERLILNYKVILPTAEHGSQPYVYTFEAPGKGWNETEYDASKWKKGEGGFGYPTQYRARIPTIYNGGATSNSPIWGALTGPRQIWVRRTFTLDRVPETAVLRHRLQGEGKIYINGKEMVSVNGSNRAYQFIEVPAGVLKKGKNVIAAEAGKKGEFNHLDFGLYDTNGEPVEADIVGPTQPNVIKGPNGFETWGVYKAFWNSINGQGKDRIYFWGDEMVTDGVTSGNSPNLHFDAFMPTFQDHFDSAESLKIYSDVSNSVDIDKDALHINAAGGREELLLRNFEPENYFLETNIRFDEGQAGKQGRAGITVWHKNENNKARLYIDRDESSLILESTFDGVSELIRMELPHTFRFLENDERVAGFGEQYHTLKVYKNSSRLYAELDHYKLNDDLPVLEDKRIASPGRLGLVAQNSHVQMDNVTLTIGWSEYKSRMDGWKGDSWSVTDKGLKSAPTDKSIAVKGDLVPEHEFSAYIDTVKLPESGKAGIVLSYIDENNYVAAYTDYAAKKFDVLLVKNGKEKLLQSAPAARYTIYGHSNYEGKLQKRYEYNLRGAAEISEAKILWTSGRFDYLDASFQLPDPASNAFGFNRWDDAAEKWSEAEFEYEVPASNNRPFSFALREEISSQNFFRTVRMDGRINMWVNHELKFSLEDPFAGKPGKVGFYSSGCVVVYDAVTAFDISSSKANLYDVRALKTSFKTDQSGSDSSDEGSGE
ncbi:hypothetical protein ACFQ88_05765 [Paenibacillus sp. NPDC056579]|uniref:hypothetical protein n=1 Tax=Paenibacillus sp. NPDC056579 TaxID=3345871 RepID=UPI0036C991A8